MSDGAPAALGQINFTGGYPTSKDLAPSVIFTIVYAVTLPVLAWRLISSKHRTVLLIRPVIFVICRLASMILRAVMAKNAWGESELIAELIFISIGYLFLIEPIVQLWKRSVATAISMDDAPTWVQRLSSILRAILLAAIGTAVAGSALISGALDNPSKLNTVVDLRKASAILSMTVAIILLFSIVATYTKFRLDARRVALLATLDIPLCVVSVYRVAQIFSTDPNSGARSAVAFWILQIVMELITFVGLIAISIPTWFPDHAAQTEALPMSASYKEGGAPNPPYRV